jgi:hypothetical protein
MIYPPIGGVGMADGKRNYSQRGGVRDPLVVQPVRIFGAARGGHISAPFNSRCRKIGATAWIDREKL